VESNGQTLVYAPVSPTPHGSECAMATDRRACEFLLERYRAFTERNGKRGWFPVWHKPWSVQPVALQLTDTSLLTTRHPWARRAHLMGAHYSNGLDDVWMGLRQNL